MTRERINSSRRWKRSLLSPIIERKKSPPPKNKKFELHYIELSDYFESRSFFSLILFHFKSFLNSSLGFLYASRGLISNMAEGSNAQGLLWILPPRAQAMSTKMTRPEKIDNLPLKTENFLSNLLLMAKKWKGFDYTETSELRTLNSNAFS